MMSFVLCSSCFLFKSSVSGLCNLTEEVLFPNRLQVFPGAWTAILVYLDNAGIWNLRAENLDSWYLGQEVYVSVVNPEIEDDTEIPLPGNTIYCGLLSSLQK